MLEFLRRKISEAGVFEYGFIAPGEIEYRQMVRDLCAENKCRKYGTTWACPPAVGTVEECRDRCLKYDTMMVFTGLVPLKNNYDFEGMVRGMSEFKQTARRLEAALRPHISEYLMLSNEGCDTCADCTYPDAPCRFPEKLHHSVEGYGILVSDLAQKAGVKYNNGDGTVTFFGAALFNRSDLTEG